MKEREREVMKAKHAMGQRHGSVKNNVIIEESQFEQSPSPASKPNEFKNGENFATFGSCKKSSKPDEL